MWQLADSDVSIPVSFLINGQLAIPDDGSITLTVRDNAGAIMTGYDAQSQPDVTTTDMLVVIPSADNSIDVDAVFETRHVLLQYTVDSIPCFFKTSYHLAPFVPLTSTPADVRAAYGAEYEELPDGDIDLIGAYFQLKSEYGSNFSDAFTSATLAQLSANEAVTVKAALNVFPSMQTRLLAGEKTDASEYTRMKLDLDKLRAGLEQRLSTLLTDVAKSTLSLAPIFSVSAPTDPVTNS